jgi:CobQ-like glutamine amidotransferase family enzyme
MPGEPVAVVLLYPELLGTYGDGGNALVLAQRLRWRGHAAEVIEVSAGETVPASANVYLMGGGEDEPQALAARELRASRALHRAIDGGAALLAVCAGFQVVGTEFVGPDGAAHEGLGLLECRTTRGAGRRRVGEIVVEPSPELGLPVLTGYENHQGVTACGPSVRPLGRVLVGSGNDTGDGTEGAVAGRVIGTYLHGPVLARNPALADHVLTSVLGPLSPLDDAEAEALRRERLAAAGQDRVLVRVRNALRASRLRRTTAPR